MKISPFSIQFSFSYSGWSGATLQIILCFFSICSLCFLSYSIDTFLVTDKISHQFCLFSCFSFKKKRLHMKNIYFSIYLFILLHWVLILACGIFNCSMQTSHLQHVGSNSLTRDHNWVPFIGNMESWPLDHQ